MPVSPQPQGCAPAHGSCQCRRSAKPAQQITRLPGAPANPRNVPAGSTRTHTAHVLQEIHHIFINGPSGLHMSARLLWAATTTTAEPCTSPPTPNKQRPSYSKKKIVPARQTLTQLHHNHLCVHPALCWALQAHWYLCWPGCCMLYSVC
jgi:hypothetical protein